MKSNREFAIKGGASGVRDPALDWLSVDNTRPKALLARVERVLVKASAQAGPAKLGQIIERRIVERTWGRIRQLRVGVCAERVVVHGQTLCYYANQLAIQAVLEALRDAGVTAVVDAGRNN